jgi:two-component system, cell cycle sensor histidine kinase and response regulator CckA
LAVKTQLTSAERRSGIGRRADLGYLSLIERHGVVAYELLRPADGGAAEWVYVSPIVESLLGYTPAEFCRPGFVAEILHSADQPGVATEAERPLQQDERVRQQYRLRRADGTYLALIDESRVARHDDEGNAIVVGFLVDAAEQRALDGQFRVAQQLETVGQLATGAAHDFNNLLTVIIGHAELALTASRGQAQLDLAAILRAAEQATGLARQLLTLSRGESAEVESSDLNAVAAETARLLRRLVNAAIEITDDLGEEPLPVLVDRSQLEQLLLNLAVNARDAMPEGGRLTIRTGLAGTQDEREARLVVEDTGVGITAAALGQIFEPFYTTKDPGKGTGLGLVTVQRIVRAGGGKIDVQSQPGVGTTFTVTLPLDRRIPAA